MVRERRREEPREMHEERNEGRRNEGHRGKGRRGGRTCGQVGAGREEEPEKRKGKKMNQEPMEGRREEQGRTLKMKESRCLPCNYKERKVKERAAEIELPIRERAAI